MDFGPRWKILQHSCLENPTGQPGRLQSLGFAGVRHDLVLSFFSGRYKRLPYSFCYEDFFPNLLHKGSEVPQTQHYILPPPASPLNPLQTSSEECLCHPHLTSVFSIAVAEEEISPAVRTPLPDHSCLHATRHFIDGEADTPDSGGGSRGSQSSGRGRGSGQLGCSKRLLPTKYVQPRWLEVKSRQSKTDFKKEHAVLVR